MTPRWLPPSRAWLGLTALLLGVAAGAWMVARVDRVRGPLEWDEAGYVWNGSVAARALSGGDVAGVFAAAGADPLHPPLHTMILAGWFTAFGASEAAAFALSAASLAIAALLIAAIGAGLGGWVGAAVATLLLLGSPLHLEHTATAMLEMPGVALALLAIGATLAHLRAGRRVTAVLAGVALAALFLEKYNYGLLLAAALGAFQILGRRRSSMGSHALWLWAPLAIVAAAWLALPGRLEGFVSFAGNRNSGLAWLPSLLFYPRSVLTDFAAGPSAAAVLVIGVASAWLVRDRDDVRFLGLVAAIGIAAMTAHPYKLERSIVTVVPALWLLAGAGAAALVRRAGLGASRREIVVAVAILLAVAAPLPRFYAREIPALARGFDTGRVPSWSHFPWPGRDLEPVQSAIVASVDPRLPIYVSGEFNELSPLTLRWKITERHPRARVVGQCFAPGTSWEPPFELVTLEVLPDSRYDTADYREFNAWALAPIHAFEKLGLARARRWEFPEAGVRLRVYRVDSLPARERGNGR